MSNNFKRLTNFAKENRNYLKFISTRLAFSKRLLNWLVDEENLFKASLKQGCILGAKHSDLDLGGCTARVSGAEHVPIKNCLETKQHLQNHGRDVASDAD